MGIRMGRNGKRLPRAGIVLLSAVAALVAIPAAASAKLLASEFEALTVPHDNVNPAFPAIVVESDGAGSYGISLKISNTGRQRVPAKQFRVLLDGDEAATFRAGPFPPRKSLRVRQVFSDDFPVLGLQPVRVCQRKCTRERRFAVVPQTWNVDSFTSGPDNFTGNPPDYSASADDLIFDFYGSIRASGVPYYAWLARGGVNGEVTGTNGSGEGACTFSGSGSTWNDPWDVVPPKEGYLRVGVDLDEYNAYVEDGLYSFSMTRDCVQDEHDDVLDEEIDPLETWSPNANVAMSPGQTTLSGSYDEPFGFGGSHSGDWSFSAAIP
ncbi:hypothetical protein HJD18_09570 [Thermoleophilia bacterium SCSIO 60948]|nr:hypothetical protein HJD18_09570 [Thermoleophilia bacterium SCSIO 60948]